MSFTSLSSGERNLGFIAEEVAKVHPLLATYDEKRRPESVRYMELTAVLSNAIQQQQKTIKEQSVALASQSAQLSKQQRELDEVNALLRDQQRMVAENAKTMRELAASLASPRAPRSGSH